MPKGTTNRFRCDAWICLAWDAFLFLVTTPVIAYKMNLYNNELPNANQFQNF